MEVEPYLSVVMEAVRTNLASWDNERKWRLNDEIMERFASVRARQQ
jgi:hypothetical protein